MSNRINQNNYPMKDWNFEHMQRTIVRQHGIDHIRKLETSCSVENFALALLSGVVRLVP